MKQTYAIQFPQELRPFLFDIGDVSVRKKISSGGFGRVSEALYRKKRVAIKVVKEEMTEHLLRRFVSEVVSLYRCHHPFIVKFIGFTNKSPYAIITEVISNTNLLHFLGEPSFDRHRTGTALTKIAMGIASGVAYLHSIQLIHRDLKPENILLDDDFYPKICDFGLIREFDKPSYATANVGTRYWMAPEIIRGGGQYNEKCDVFSFAMILYQMLTRKLPFHEISPDNVTAAIEKGMRPQLPSNIPFSLKQMIIACWDNLPMKRPSFTQIYEQFASGEVLFEGTIKSEIQHFHDYIVSLSVHPSPQPNLYKMTTEKKSHYSCIPFENIEQKREKTPPKRKKKKEVIEHIRLESDFNRPQIKGLDDTFSNSYEQHKNRSQSSEMFSKFRLRTMNLESKYFEDPNNSFREQDDEIYVIAPKYQGDRALPPSLHYQSSFRSKEQAPELATPSLHFDESTAAEISFLKEEETYANFNSPYYSSKKSMNKVILKDTKHPLFPTELKKVSSELPKSEAKSFMRIASDHFRAGTDIAALKNILESMVEVVTNETTIREFEILGFKNILPYEEEGLIETIFDVLIVVFSQKPSIFEHNYKQTMNRLFNSSPEKSLLLISFFVKKFEEIEDPWELTDLFIKKENIFFGSEVDSEYITIIYHLLHNYSNFYESRIDICRPIISKFITSPHINTAKCAYNAMCQLYDKQFIIPFDKVISDLNERSLYKNALSLLIRVNRFPIVEELIYSLIKLSRKNEIASLLVLKLCQKPYVSQQLAEASNWLLYELPTYQRTLSIFVSISQFKASRKKIINSPEIPHFFLSLVKTKDADILMFFPYIFSSLEITQQFINSFEKVDFFSNLYKVMTCKSRTIRISCLETCAIIAKTRFVKSMLQLIPILKEYIYEEPSVARAALKLFLSLSYYSKALKIFTDQHIEVILRKAFKQEEGSKKYVDEFCSNIITYNQ